MNREQDYLLKMLSASVNGTASPEFDEIDLKYLYDYSAQNQFDHIVYNHLSSLGIHDESDPIMHSFHQRYGFAVRRDYIQDAELAEISELLTEKNIRHMPLKGSVVKQYYPLPDLRRSGDIDLLISGENRDEADKALLSLGYECTISGREVEDVYERGRSVVELHFRLTGNDDISADFCDDVWEHSSAVSGCMYQMEPEYMYVYLLAHLRKHILEAGGGGIKLILDFYVLKRMLELDEKKLEKYTEQAKLKGLRSCAEALSEKWFSEQDSDDKDVLMLEELILNSGAHGDYGKYIDIALSRSSGSKSAADKTMNFIRLICPPLKVMRVKYPVLEKHPLLLPLSWLWRIRDARAEHTRAVISSSLKGLSKSEARELAEFCENISV